jgi:hypothetical protein
MIAEILSWDPINTNEIQPCIYIKPTLDLLQFFNRSKKVLLKISDTKSCYDDNVIFGIVDKSSDVPNCRQNFFNYTGLYIITLSAPWYGYPLEKGKVEFINPGVVIDNIINEHPDQQKQESLMTTTFKQDSNQTESGYNGYALGTIVVALVGIALVSLIKYK